MAHKKGVGSTKNGRDSESKRLGVKRADGQFVLAGNILVRTWAAAATTRCSPLPTARSASSASAATARRSASSNKPCRRQSAGPVLARPFLIINGNGETLKVRPGAGFGFSAPLSGNQMPEVFLCSLIPQK